MSIRPLNEKDVIALKDNRVMEILKVKYKDGSITDFAVIEAINRNEASPMRTTIFPDMFRRVIHKAPRAYDWELKRWAEFKDGQYVLVDRRTEWNPNYLKLYRLRADRRLTKYEYKKEEVA